MLEGEIIKFYRKRAGLTQEQLGKDICTATHVSKIERGHTQYSEEIIDLFSARLHIDIKKEIENLQNIEKKLHQWHSSIIMLRKKEADKIKTELERLPFISSSNHGIFYQLLLARYYILNKEGEKAFTIVQHIQKENPQSSPYERNLLQHVIGLCYLEKYNNFSSENRNKAIEALKGIQQDDYPNREYHYHLAVAYHWIESKTMAYLHAEKALHFFKETNNFFRAIQSEAVMLLQKESLTKAELNLKIARYHQLIEDCDAISADEIKAMLLHNAGLECFKRKEYASAHPFYKRALKMADKNKVIYLNRLYNYADNCMEGKLIPQKSLLKIAEDGLDSAKKMNSTLYKILFTLLCYKIKNAFKEYYLYIEESGLPFFQTNNQKTMIDKFGKQLYTHYTETEQYEKAVRIADGFIQQQ
ncbi:helix-turn-helix transcriptional regulator [Metabacillus indicus]|uniref:helix-turn-helix domain-containing protein n=1 Tax=Metabacillus indicus TaxID=246786 RepID=UPI002A08C27F|nr:helix-turn-helix transcriptional regulator [Metabacillus indicus]MDX8289290.1 helix-turn-helix transcriptional regulator [Metabacillus indicus]